jgi:putative endonuclease
MKAFFVYMVTNRSRVVLYTGVTNDLERRVWEHKHGTVKGFTKRYKLDRLVYYENYSEFAMPLHGRRRSRDGDGKRKMRWFRP